MALTIATFNLRSRSFTEDGTDTGDRAWHNRIDEAADYVIRTGASLVALQEVDFFPAPRQSQELAAKLFELTGKTWSRLEDTSRPGAFIYDTSVVTVIEGGTAAQTETVDPGYSGKRRATWAKFHAAGLTEPFWVIRTHFPTTTQVGDGSIPAMYAQAAKIVADRADLLRSTGSRVVIMGDFNHHEYPHSGLVARGYQDVRGLAPTVANAYLRSFNGWDETMVNRQDGRWIDGIFFSDGWRVTSAGLEAKYASGNTLPLATPLPSDHFPIFATIEEASDPGPAPDPGLVVPESRDTRPRLLTGDVVTGRIARDLTPLLSECSWSVGLNAAGRIEATVPIDGMPARDRRELRASLGEGRNFLAVAVGDSILEAGPIQYQEFDAAAGVVQLVATGIRALLEQRTVVSAPTVWDVVDGSIDEGLSVQRSSLEYTGLSWGTIAKRIVQNSLAMPGGSLPIVFAPDVVGAESAVYRGYELPNLARELDRISSGASGPDIEFRPRFTADYLGIEWEMLTGSPSDPLLHQSGGDWVLDLRVARGASVAGLTVRTDGTDRANLAWTSGTGHDTALRISPRSNAADWQSGYPLRESVEAHPDVETWEGIHRLGEARIRRGSRPTVSWNVSLLPSPPTTPALGQFRPGDWFRLRLAEHLWIPDGDYRVRCSGFSGSFSSDLIAVTFIPTLEAR